MSDDHKNITFEEWEARQMQDAEFREAVARIDADCALVEQRIAESGLRPYQAMVVRTIAQDENATAALNWIERLKELEVSDAERA